MHGLEGQQDITDGKLVSHFWHVKKKKSEFLNVIYLQFMTI